MEIVHKEEEKEEEIFEDDMEHNYFIPRECYDVSEPMDIPSVGNNKYFRFAPVRRHEHPTNPDTNGLISSRILPDGSNTIRFTTAMSADFVIPDNPDYNALIRMESKEFQEEYKDCQEKPFVVTHGQVGLYWKE